MGDVSQAPAGGQAGTATPHLTLAISPEVDMAEMTELTEKQRAFNAAVAKLPD